MIGVQENRIIEFLAEAFHDRRELLRSGEFPLAFGSPHHYGSIQSVCRLENSFQEDEIRNVEVSQRHLPGLCLLQYFIQCLHLHPQPFIASETITLVQIAKAYFHARAQE
jgi:hypothetical protein